MRQANDDRVMMDFLLGRLDGETREQILDQLGTDEAYFESMAALEDDLILRWHRGELSPEDGDLFAREYAAPARRARVDAALELLGAAAAWKEKEVPASVLFRLRTWATSQQLWPRLAAAGAAVVLLAGLSWWVFGRGAESTGTTRPGTVAFTLAAVGERGTPSEGFDRIDLPRDATSVELTVESPSVPGDARLTAEIRALDRGTTLPVAPPVVSKSNATTRVTVTVATTSLPDGDYVLTLRDQGAPGSEPVATQSFRVSRRPN